MAGLGSGYDLSVSTFSPDGRVFQVEYAAKAVDSAALCVAAACKGGVAFAVEKPKVSAMLAQGSNRRIFPVTKDIGMVVAGLVPDGRQLWHRARAEARAYLKGYGVSIPIGVLAERLALFMHAYSLYWHVRPFGATCILGGLQADPVTGFKELKGEVYSIDPSGCCSRYWGTAAGQNRPSAKTELEKLPLSELDPEGLGDELARVLLVLREEGQSEGKTEIEIGSLSIQGGQAVFGLWDSERVAAAVTKAKQAIEAMESD
ncbi:proteasome subunit alpha type-3 [Cyclospora cayetanensis]|uniref:Proteasome subunit alpha type-3 n=2 Tax=Cyclospora cayetanensis TaxID=88456 RepID=A0A6P5WDL2_9EIME|nr:proteasome subunit alpha type-3 [Cyclospora cayetanensis]OEH78106.1 proteasome subunit alpha type [Cyclospora cayetanensis]